MPTMQMSGVAAAIGAGANQDIQPAAGNAYCIEEVFSDQAYLGGPPTVPDVQVSLFNGVLAAAIVLLDPTTAVQKQHRPMELYINNATYARLTNTAVGAAVIGWSGHRVIPENVMSVIVTAPNAGTVDLQPTVAQGVWRITEIGCEIMNATNWPDITVVFSNGVIVTPMALDGARTTVWMKLLNWYISNALYLTFAPIAAADRDVGISAIRVDKELFGACVAIGAGATVLIQPAAGVDAVVTQVCGSVWNPAAPNGTTDCLVELTDGATPSTVLEAGSVSLGQRSNRKLAIEINNAIYLQVTDTAGAGCNMAYCGYISRRWNP